MFFDIYFVPVYVVQLYSINIGNIRVINSKFMRMCVLLVLFVCDIVCDRFRPMFEY